jgi:hypothetical protein
MYSLSGTGIMLHKQTLELRLQASLRGEPEAHSTRSTMASTSAI